MSHHLQTKRRARKQQVVVETAPAPKKAPAKKAPAKAKAPARAPARTTRKKAVKAE